MPNYVQSPNICLGTYTKNCYAIFNCKPILINHMLLTQRFITKTYFLTFFLLSIISTSYACSSHDNVIRFVGPEGHNDNKDILQDLQYILPVSTDNYSITPSQVECGFGINGISYTEDSSKPGTFSKIVGYADSYGAFGLPIQTPLKWISEDAAEWTNKAMEKAGTLGGQHYGVEIHVQAGRKGSKDVSEWIASKYPNGFSYTGASPFQLASSEMPYIPGGSTYSAPVETSDIRDKFNFATHGGLLIIMMNDRLYSIKGVGFSQYGKGAGTKNIWDIYADPGVCTREEDTGALKCQDETSGEYIYIRGSHNLKGGFTNNTFTVSMDGTDVNRIKRDWERVGYGVYRETVGIIPAALNPASSSLERSMNQLMLLSFVVPGASTAEGAIAKAAEKGIQESSAKVIASTVREFTPEFSKTFMEALDTYAIKTSLNAEESVLAKIDAAALISKYNSDLGTRLAADILRDPNIFTKEFSELLTSETTQKLIYDMIEASGKSGYLTDKEISTTLRDKLISSIGEDGMGMTQAAAREASRIAEQTEIVNIVTMVENHLEIIIKNKTQGETVQFLKKATLPDIQKLFAENSKLKSNLSEQIQIITELSNARKADNRLLAKEFLEKTQAEILEKIAAEDTAISQENFIKLVKEAHPIEGEGLTEVQIKKNVEARVKMVEKLFITTPLEEKSTLYEKLGLDAEKIKVLSPEQLIDIAQLKGSIDNKIGKNFSTEYILASDSNKLRLKTKFLDSIKQLEDSRAKQQIVYDLTKLDRIAYIDIDMIQAVKNSSLISDISENELNHLLEIVDENSFIKIKVGNTFDKHAEILFRDKLGNSYAYEGMTDSKHTVMSPHLRVFDTEIININVQFDKYLSQEEVSNLINNIRELNKGDYFLPYSKYIQCGKDVNCRSFLDKSLDKNMINELKKNPFVPEHFKQIKDGKIPDLFLRNNFNEMIIDEGLEHLRGFYKNLSSSEKAILKDDFLKSANKLKEIDKQQAIANLSRLDVNEEIEQSIKSILPADDYPLEGIDVDIDYFVATDREAIWQHLNLDSAMQVSIRGQKFNSIRSLNDNMLFIIESKNKINVFNSDVLTDSIITFTKYLDKAEIDELKSSLDIININ
ncbi:MAG: hypothetical protein ACI9BN_000955 [Francisella sp.]|jgi:hypothetical protein